MTGCAVGQAGLTLKWMAPLIRRGSGFGFVSESCEPPAPPWTVTPRFTCPRRNPMGAARRKFTKQYKADAVQLYQDSAWIHRVNAGDRFRGGRRDCDLDRGIRACFFCRLPVLRLVRVFRLGSRDWWPGRPCGAVTGSGLVRPPGRAADRRRLRSRFIHSQLAVPAFGQVQVTWPRPWRAIRAATSMRSRRMVAPGPWRRTQLARAPAARSRLCAMAARASHAAFAGKRPEGRWARGPLGQVRDHLLDDGVVTVLCLGLDQLERGVGEQRRGSARS